MARSDGVLRTVVRGKRRDIGLGGLRLVSLADAREDAARLRRIARTGGDPLAERRQARRIMPTFKAAAEAVHDAHSSSFKNEKHKSQWITRRFKGKASNESLEAR